MKPADRVKELQRAVRQLKKGNRSTADIRPILRLKALIAYYRQQPLEQVAACFDLSLKSLKRWIKCYEANGIEALADAPRSGRPPLLTEEQKALLTAEMQKDRQRVWVARHVLVLIQTLFGVMYAVGYLPELLRAMGMSFRKGASLPGSTR